MSVPIINMKTRSRDAEVVLKGKQNHISLFLDVSAAASIADMETAQARLAVTGRECEFADMESCRSP